MILVCKLNNLKNYSKINSSVSKQTNGFLWSYKQRLIGDKIDVNEQFWFAQ